ncbi:hypothetical protein K438DRAFT_1911309 [Mycena galopus ATCC 62051]|nr:hypothetical protein K438DRAFT_1911309 [Mycena galopus ATCC 62051]
MLCFTLPLLLEATDIAMIVSLLSALMIDQDIVSIATSLPFRKSTLSKPAFMSKLQCVCINEAHCISLWGGSFCSDYTNLGILRGHIPSNVPFVVASATLPAHILDDVLTKLGLSKNATQISLTNARPNVALSCQTMKHPEESKADLRFLIHLEAKKPTDIHIGEICILFCTDVVWMGCDMRNMEQVILLGLPPSFCSLIQRAGRAACDFSKLGEAISIILPSVIKNGVSEEEIEAAVGDAAQDTESENRGLDMDVDLLLNEGIELTSGHKEVVFGEGGIWAGKDSDEEDGNTSEVKHKRRKKQSKECNSREADFLSQFACTKKCRRKIWDLFFDNDLKDRTRCCDNCEPQLFEVEEIKLDKIPSLKRGRKKEMDKELAELIKTELMDWREDYLLDEIYSETTIISAGTVLGDVVIEQLVKERIEAPQELRRHTRWTFGFQGSTLELSDHGEALFRKLQSIYEAHDTAVKAKHEQIVNLPPLTSKIATASFYAGTTH